MSGKKSVLFKLHLMWSKGNSNHWNQISLRGTMTLFATTEKRGYVICNRWEEEWRYLQPLRKGVSLFATAEKRSDAICNRWEEGWRYLQPQRSGVLLHCNTEVSKFWPWHRAIRVPTITALIPSSVLTKSFLVGAVCAEGFVLTFAVTYTEEIFPVLASDEIRVTSWLPVVVLALEHYSSAYWDDISGIL